MKIVVLTSETIHHAYFVRELVKTFPVEQVLIECNVFTSPFETHHNFEDKRDEYERDIFFNKKGFLLKDVVSVKEFASVNDVEAVRYLKKLQPDIIIVFGTGKVLPEVIQVCPKGIVNLHGGDPEEYRGLDSHLWAIYHKDFTSLITTLHHLNENLDDGSTILQCKIPLTHGMLIHELRRYNTEICIKLVLNAIKMYETHSHFLSKPQRKCGRYYSFMPSVLKEICKIHFEEYTSKL
jgi:methionyl-tRNA formyltransferase